MDAIKTQQVQGRGGAEQATSSRNTPGAQSCANCRILQSKVQNLESHLQLKSLQFSEAIAQLTSNQRAKSRVQQLDERFIEQCVRAKAEAEIELNNKSKQSASQLEQFKALAIKKNNELLRQVNSLRHQLSVQKTDYQSKIAEVAENARHDVTRYEKIINKLKTDLSEAVEIARTEARQEYAGQAEKVKQLEQQNLQLKQEFQKRLGQAATELRQKSQAWEKSATQLKDQYEKKIAAISSQVCKTLTDKDAKSAAIKEQLTQVSEQVAASARAKARAEQLNQRLTEQCSMAKAGADVEIELKTKKFAENIACFKGQATAKLKALVDQNARLKAQAEQAMSRLKDHAGALRKANTRINLLKQTVINLKNVNFAGQQA
jgi:hypothetical protein